MKSLAEARDLINKAYSKLQSEAEGKTPRKKNLCALVQVSLLLLLVFSSGFLISYFIFDVELNIVQVEFEEVQEFFTHDIWINDTNLNDFSFGDLRSGYNSSTGQFYVSVNPIDRIHHLTLYLFQKGYFMNYPVLIWGCPEDTDFSFVNLHTTLSFPDIDKSSFYVNLTFWKLV